MKKGKAFNLGYFQAPEDALEDPDEMAQWAQQAYSVALKANAKKPGK
jgi:TfoX/Sxy family transcriptional regulator of competence genes